MNKNNITIRLEKKEEYREVENLVRESFWNVYRPGCLEHFVLNQLRNNPDFIVELDYVMELNGKLIGQNIFMKAVIKADDGSDIPIVIMGPICITSELKRKGYGVNVVNVRLVKEPSLYSAEPIKTPEDVFNAVANELKQYDREVFAIINLKTNGQIINLNVCSVGTLSASLISPREVFKSSILSNAAAFIAIHNHPSGNITPSAEDKEVTERLMACGEFLDIKMLDHIIVAGESGKMLSMKAEG